MLGKDKEDKTIQWEFVMWIEKCHSYAAIKGYDDNGNEYHANAVWFDGELIEILDGFEKVEPELSSALEG